MSPDAGGLKRAQRYATALNASLAVVAKIRPRPDVAVALQVLGEVRGRACLIVDDLASTGRTIVGAAEAWSLQARRRSTRSSSIAVMAPDALKRICAGPVQRLVSTDSVPTQPDPRLQIVSLAPLLAKTLTRLSAGNGRMLSSVHGP